MQGTSGWARHFLEAPEQAPGLVSALVADAGYFSAANVQTCEASGIEPLLLTQKTQLTARICWPGRMNTDFRGHARIHLLGDSAT